MSLAPGSTLHGRYHLESELGRGGMGWLFRARDTLLEREVAVKVLDPGALGEAGRARLLHEARAAAKLNHPNIVTVHDVGDADGTPFIVLELIEGPSLHASRPSAIPEIVRVAQEVCAALEHAHAHGLVHRDLKPENILGHTDGPAKLTDFGLARPIATRITSEGALTGTVFYLAPEQALGQVIDGRADLYALGVMLYELVAGRLPFTADDPLAVITQHLYAPVVPPTTYNPDLPPALESLILSLLSKEADDRPPSAGLVKEALAAMDLSASGAAQSQTVLNGIARGRFVGREAELVQCKAAWLEAAAGTRRVVILEGEAGVGKTRLAKELATQVAVLGGTVLPGECYAEGAAPYAPIGEAIRQALAGNDGRSLKLANFVLQDLAVLSPALRTSPRRSPAAKPADPQAELHRLCESVVSVFERLSQRAPVMLLVEDLQWADSGTLCLLRHLAHRAHVAGLRLLAVLTYRPVESVQARGLFDFLRELERNAQTTHLRLQPFTREETRRMLEAMFQREITEEFLEGIQQETGGNPFFVEEACKTLVSRGDLILEAGRWERDKPMAELEIPQSLRIAILSRFARMKPETQDSLRRAAIIGQDFEVAVLRHASDLSLEQLDACLEEAEEAQFIHVPRAGAGLRYAFGHGLMPQTIASELSSVRSSRLHARVGAAIERVHADRLDQVAPALGRHFAQAGQAAKAAEYLLMAGEAAQSALALEEAIDCYEQAVPLLHSLSDRTRASDTRIKLGSLYHAVCQFEDSRRAFRDGFALRQQSLGESCSAEEAGSTLPPAPHPLRLRQPGPLCLDPCVMADIGELRLMEQLCSGLVECAPEMNILPEVAWSWDILDAGRKYVFHLRDDWRWSDGVPVTSHDFVYAWRRLLDPRSKSPSRDLLRILRGGQAFDPGGDPPLGDLGVKAIDDLTLAVELEEPAGYFMHMLAVAPLFPLPRHVVDQGSDEWARGEGFVSNGPFTLEVGGDSETWSLRRNPYYPGRFRGNLQQVELKIVLEGSEESWQWGREELACYEAGRIDVASLPLPEAQKARQHHAGEEISWPGLQVFSVLVNWRRPPLDDPRVRRALGMGMNRTLLVARTYGDDAVPADGGLVPIGVPGHSPGIGLAFDPVEARRLLAAAGSGDPRSLPPISLLHPDNSENHDVACNLTELWLEELGIPIEPRPVSYQAYMERLRAGEYDLSIAGWVADYPDPDSFLRVYVSLRGELDIDPEFRRLVTEAARLMDQRTRLAVYARADRLLTEQAIFLPIVYGTGRAFIKPWIRREPKWYHRYGCWKDVIIDPH